MFTVPTLVRRAVFILPWFGLAMVAGAQTAPPPDPLIEKLGRYVAGYGEAVSAFLGIETYTQSVTIGEAPPLRPRKLIAEFAIVKADGGWTGFRDVVQVDTTKISDRRDRLTQLLSGTSADGPSLVRLANESARYNIGPIGTNLNLPTTALFFFEPANLPRFTFKRKGTKTINGTETVEMEFKETVSPTIVMTRTGRNVPLEGTLWIADDGTVIRTRLRMKNFADTQTSKMQQMPGQRPAVNPNVPTTAQDALSRAGGVDPVGMQDIETSADIDTTYNRHKQLGVWLPSKMSEQYVGPIRMGARPPVVGTSNTRASYSEFKQFGTGARLKIVR
jgi:hypothetical protein